MDISGVEHFIGADDTDSLPQIPPVWFRRTRLTTIPAAVVQAFFILTLIGMAVVLKHKYLEFEEKCLNLSVLLLYQAVLWFLATFIHHFYEVQHARLRVRGYQSFYKHFRTLSSYQFVIFSWWNVFTVMYLMGSLTYAPDALCVWEDWFSAINLAVYSIYLHGSLLVFLIVLYSRDVTLFNRTSHYTSDIEAIEAWRQEIIDLNKTDVGLNEEVVRLVEKQAYLIEFYQNQIRNMSHWVASHNESTVAPT